MAAPHLLLVDGSNLFFRLFYRKACKRPEQVVPYLRPALKGMIREWDATHLIIALDHPTPCFRYALYPEYKQRKGERTGPSAQDLNQAVMPALADWGVCMMAAETYEADDVIATVNRAAVHAGTQVSILSTDRDLWTLIRDGHTRVLYPGKGEEQVIRETEVMEHFGITPDQIPDLKILAGDKSDNVPKVGTDKNGKRYGFTEERAAELLRYYGSLDALTLEVVPDPILPKEMEWLGTCDAQIHLMRKVVDLNYGVMLSGDLDLSPVGNLS